MQGIPQGQHNQGGGSQKPSLSWQSPAAKPISAHEKPKPPMPPQKNNTPNNPVSVGGKSNMSTYAGIFVAGLVVGALLGWGLSGRGTGSTSQTATSTDTENSEATNSSTDGSLTGTVAESSQGIAVAANQAAGRTVSVSNVTLEKATWLVVYDDINGAPGKALGAQLFFAGGATSGTISLIRSTVSGHSYLLGERVDNGDHKYATATDKPVTDASGKEVLVSFAVN